MICRGTDILKYFRESLGIQDNESKLHREILILHHLAEVPACLESSEISISLTLQYLPSMFRQTCLSKQCRNKLFVHERHSTSDTEFQTTEYKVQASFLHEMVSYQGLHSTHKRYLFSDSFLIPGIQKTKEFFYVP